MKFDIKRYSSFDNYTVKSCGDNISNVMDKLLRLTTKLTERYASDILYLIPSVDKATKDGIDVDVVIMFKESGVGWKNSENDAVEVYTDETYLQCWRLTADCGRENLMELTRVYLVADNIYSKRIIGM